jgi:hypothetical protein
MVQSSSMIVGASPECITQLSWTLVRAPMMIGLAFWSDLSTAPHQMLASSPTVTSPIITAVGAMKAVGEILGRLPLYSMIIPTLASDQCCVTIFDGHGEIKVGRGSTGSKVQRSILAILLVRFINDPNTLNIEP